jgi:hypothetical protein
MIDPGRPVLRSSLSLDSEPFITAMQGPPVAMPFGDELVQRLQ